MRWLTAPANRMPDGNGNPAIPTVILYLYLLYNKVHCMTKKIASLLTKVTAAVFIGIMRILILLGILKSVIYGREHYFLGFSWVYLSCC